MRLSTLERISNSSTPILAAEDRGMMNKKTTRSDKLRQVMESRGHGNLIETLKHSDRFYGSTKKSEVIGFHGDNDIPRTRDLVRGTNSEHRGLGRTSFGRSALDLSPRVEDVSDDPNPTSVLNPPFEGGRQHNDDESIDNNISVSYPSLRSPTHEVPVSGSGLCGHKGKGASQQIYGSSAGRLETVSFEGPSSRRPKRSPTGQFFDQDRPRSSMLDAPEGFLGRPITERLHHHKQQLPHQLIPTLPYSKIFLPADIPALSVAMLRENTVMLMTAVTQISSSRQDVRVEGTKSEQLSSSVKIVPKATSPRRVQSKTTQFYISDTAYTITKTQEKLDLHFIQSRILSLVTYDIIVTGSDSDIC